MATSAPAGRKAVTGNVDDIIRSFVFFGLLYLYLWLVVKPCLIYGSASITNFPVFYRDWPFFRDCIASPGGLVRYVCAFLSQLFYFSWAGAAVITALAWALSACTGCFFTRIGMPGARWLRFVPALLVLVAHARYAYHLPTMLGFLTSMALLCLYVALTSGGTVRTRGRSMHMAVFLVLSVVSYTAGAAAYLLFAALCVTYELVSRSRSRSSLLYLSLAVVVPYGVGVLVLGVSLVDAYTEMLPVSWRILGWSTRQTAVAAVYALYLFPIAVALGRGLWRLLAGWRHARRTGARGRPRQEHTRSARVGWADALVAAWRRSMSHAAVRWAIQSALLFAVAGAVAVVSLDGRTQAILEVHYYACHRMWPEVLAAARRCPESYFAINAVNRALFHTGRLGRDMFSYVQHPDALLLTGDDHILQSWHKFDTLMDLGLMNLAEKNLAECVEIFGAHPMILKRLALVNLVKGKTEAARIYLAALGKTLFHARWANDYLARLRADPDLSDDPDIQDLRARSLKTDYTAEFFAKEALLTALLEGNRHNRMAFEYLMAQYMLTRKLDKVVQNIGRLNDFGDVEIPLLYQEALLIYAYGARKPVPLDGRTISPEVTRRIEHFSAIFNRHNRNKQAAFRELAAQYAGSYFFYNIYGF